MFHGCVLHLKYRVELALDRSGPLLGPLDVHRRVMATALGVLAFTGALRTHISQLFSFFLVHLLEIYTCLSNTQIYSTLGGTLIFPFTS